MGVLIVTPSWEQTNAVWLQRMINILEPDVAAIVTYGAPTDTWKDRIPVLSLDNKREVFLRKIAYRSGVSLDLLPITTASQVLKTSLASNSVDSILVHFADFALKFEHVWRKAKKPVFVHCHGYDVTWDLRLYEEPTRKFFDEDYVASIARLSQYVTFIANSKCTLQRLIDIGVAKERIVVKYLGTPVPEAAMQRPTGLPIEILYLGRFVDCKGPDLVIRAFEKACSKGLNARLMMVGYGPMEEVCRSMQEASAVAERISIIGRVDEHEGDSLRARADIFTAHNCRGSRSQQEEAFGVSCVEAMAVALPVVTGNSGGVNETVVHGETGILFEPGDIEAHAEALYNLGADHELRWRMGLAGWKRAKQYFTLENESIKLRSILNIR